MNKNILFYASVIVILLSLYVVIINDTKRAINQCIEAGNTKFTCEMELRK